jgi:hypothetical protein
MTMKRSWSGILIVILSVGLVRPARADNGEKVLIVIAATTIAAAISVVAIVAGVHHRRKKITITGCVIPGENGMTVTDEEDSKTYALTGDTKDIKPGERMRLEGKKLKPQGPGKASVWEAKGVIQDFGYCQP